MYDLRIKLKEFVLRTIFRRLKNICLARVPRNGAILDVGCGNNSPFKFKSVRPDCYYVGIDVGVYNQTADYQTYADELILTQPDRFAAEIEGLGARFDAIFCVHNLEHCDDYLAVAKAMSAAVKPGGFIYMAFPCEASVHFPRRKGTLNFYDDPTHQTVIPFDTLLKYLADQGLAISYAAKRYRPIIPFLIGLITEPICYLFNIRSIGGGTWALYGFESVILASKTA